MKKGVSEARRLVIMLSVLKNPLEQINYGTDKDANDKTIAVAKAPIRLQRYGDSRLTVPLWPFSDRIDR